MTRRSLVALAAAGCATALAAPASAGGITVPRVGGLNFSSPVEGLPSAFWWNPAALGLMPGLQIGVDLDLTVALGSYERTIDPFGAPAAAGRYPLEKFTAIAPGPLVSATFKASRITFGAALFVPYGRDVDYPGFSEADTADPTTITDATSPGRYHLLHADFKHFYLTPGVSVELVRDTVWLGATFNVMYAQFASWLAADFPANSEDPSQQTISRLGARCAGTVDDSDICSPDADGTLVKLAPLTSLDFGFTAGVLLKPTDSFKLGASISSGAKSHFEGKGLFTTFLPQTYEADMDLTYKLPWTFNVGAEYKLRHKLEIDVWYTFQNYGVHENFVICVGSADGIEGSEGENALCADDAADNGRISNGLLNKAYNKYRGFKASHAVNVGVAYPVVKDKVKVGLSVMYENSAVPKSALSLASVDGKKLDFMLTALFSPTPWLDLSVGVSYIWGPKTDNTGESVFRRSSTFCDPKMPDSAPICGTEEFGPADGIYKLGVFRAGLGVTVKLFQPKPPKTEFYIPPTTPASGPASEPSVVPTGAPASAPAPAPAPAPVP